jgi:hypothetical protein
MVDIYTEMGEEEGCGTTIASLLEEILSRPLHPARHSNLICVQCCEIVQIIEKLDAQVRLIQIIEKLDAQVRLIRVF